MNEADRLLHTQEVAGSSPAAPTTNPFEICERCFRLACVCTCDPLQNATSGSDSASSLPARSDLSRLLEFITDEVRTRESSYLPDPSPDERADIEEALWALSFVRYSVPEFNLLAQLRSILEVPDGAFILDVARQRMAQRIPMLSGKQIQEQMAALHPKEEPAKSGIAALKNEAERLRALLNTPEVENFDKAVPLEAAHQQERWGSAHDAGKEPEDWFWLVGYLAGKALAAYKAGNSEKAKHHCISASAAFRNWHAHIRSGVSAMRPGIEEPK